MTGTADEVPQPKIPRHSDSGVERFSSSLFPAYEAEMAKLAEGTAAPEPQPSEPKTWPGSYPDGMPYDMVEKYDGLIAWLQSEDGGGWDFAEADAAAFLFWRQSPLLELSGPLPSEARDKEDPLTPRRSFDLARHRRMPDGPEGTGSS